MAHPAILPIFSGELFGIAGEVAAAKARGTPGWEGSAKAKLLERVVELIVGEIPKNPAGPEYEQGNTLGADTKGWRRAKSLGRFRLFFRFDSRPQVIVYAWVNDEGTLRKEGSAVRQGCSAGPSPRECVRSSR
ncbi:type II toxin-antitoxin system YhaV family toxin [Falsiroseomonas sp.]|uniref:type II toxin-antitoxin system YhaV family toxin n=1 Tax=Falsiroseomonas sp. TaxID=2870721 RepID=UPI0035673311